MAPLHRAIPLPERQHGAVRIGKQLDLDVPRALDVALAEDRAVTERGFGLPLCGRERLVEAGGIADDAHAAAAAARSGLHDERIPDLVRFPRRHHGHAGLHGDSLGSQLVAAESQGLRRRADPGESGCRNGFREVRVLRQKPVARMDRVRSRLARGTQMLRRIEVRGDRNRLAGRARVEGVGVVGSGHRDGVELELAAGPEDAHGDLAAVRHQHLPDRVHRETLKSGGTLARRMRRLLLTCVIALACAAPAGAGTLFLIDGRGWGHGIGMSQYGARGYAESGWPYSRILAHYYRGTELKLVPGRQVRVLLLEGQARVTIGSSKPFRVVGPRGKARTLKAQTLVLAPGRPKGRLKGLKLPLRFEPGAAPLRVDGDAYRGVLLLHAERKRLSVVNKLPLDRYLRGVVPWEMPEDWHREALKAQAVVARSYALATLKPGKRFDLYADTRSQVYGGIRAEEVSTNRAIGATAGRVLYWGGTIATTFYHSTSGGRTAPIADVWPRATPLPYLVSVPDPHDRISKHHRWGPVLLTQGEIASKLKARGVRDVLVERTPSGRVGTVSVKAHAGVRTVLAQDFRRELDLRSTWFTVRVLRLDPHLRRVVARRPTKLTGFVRGLTKVRLEQQVGGGVWQRVRPVKTRADGRFTVTVTPGRTTSYRLASAVGAGGAITLKTR